MVAVIALMATPTFAQREGRRDGGDSRRREGVERAQPRRGGESRGRVERNGNRRNDRRTYERTAPRSFGQWEGRRDGGSDRNRGYDRRDESRAYSNRRYDNRADNWRGYDNRAYGHRSYDRRYDNRAYGYRSYGHRSYGYRPYLRSYGVPYGYRPYGYRPGWSLDLYFGRPYATYGYPAYGYPPARYGYYGLVPGRAYGALRIIDAPRDAQVFVDGYYAGVVDDYDGVFQHLNLEAGPHDIAIEVPGYPPVRFDVYIEPGRTTTYRVPIY